MLVLVPQNQDGLSKLRKALNETVLVVRLPRPSDVRWHVIDGKRGYVCHVVDTLREISRGLVVAHVAVSRQVQDVRRWVKVYAWRGRLGAERLPVGSEAFVSRLVAHVEQGWRLGRAGARVRGRIVDDLDDARLATVAPYLETKLWRKPAELRKRGLLLIHDGQASTLIWMGRPRKQG